MLERRRFIRYLGAGAIGLAGPAALAGAWRRAAAADRPRPEPVPGDTGARGRVVVVGGGMAGSTAAKYLRLWGGAGVAVTLIDESPRYKSCILSNMVLNGTRSMDALTFGHGALARRYGVEVITGRVADIDPIGRRVLLEDGRRVAFDRAVVAPGIDFDTIPGLESPQAQTTVPHAWKAGPQTIALRDQLAGMRPGGVFVLTIPPSPYRCPPGPYERACVVADYVKTHKPGGKVIVLDANPSIVAEKENFTRAFEVVHAGVIEYHPSVTVFEIDASTRTLDTSIGSIAADVVNAIPPQRAGGIVRAAGLDDVGGKWAGVDVLSYESTVAPGIHVIGDAAATTQPKAGHIGNAEAKVCADAITRLLRGDPVDPAPVTNSSCYTPITVDRASWLSVVYAYDPVSRTMKAVGGAPTEARAATKDNFEQMLKWFENLMADTFA